MSAANNYNMPTDNNNNMSTDNDFHMPLGKRSPQSFLKNDGKTGPIKKRYRRENGVDGLTHQLRHVSVTDDINDEADSGTNMDVDEQQKKKRGPYNVPSTETVVVAAREVMAGKAELQVSKQYNIKVSTLRDHMRSYAENGTWEKKSTGKKKVQVIFTDIMNSWLSDFIDNNSVATHGEIYS